MDITGKQMPTTSVNNCGNYRRHRNRHLQHQHVMVRTEPLIRNSSLWVNSGEADPMAARFPGIDSTDFLDAITGRTSCRRCHRSRKYYCYTCYELMDGLAGRVPRVALPVDVDIIKHVQEVDGKSTAPHAVIVAPDRCSVRTFPDIPDYSDQNAVLVFPAPNARTLQHLIDDYRHDVGPHPDSAVDNGSVERADKQLPFNRVVFIDSTWRQTNHILRDPRISPLLANRTVILSEHESLFWRHQRDSPRTYLSTIEAIYYFFSDLQHILDERDGNGGHNDHRYDNLLFFFKHTYNKLRLKYNI
ncbi:unnamed protein product [Medioppia subpectinata]|uniref:tRNA-uridine aminocarboxypropyltransferase 1 n=1 Tax=Medioppia subpectinata TaxID=1979941 RepID=A0A7R9L1P3_9ACAR|nr:unnamed protein product [Medioppia subpectinata]CAG2112668.1 unnamed protein product [Medioppia subpectinata]